MYHVAGRRVWVAGHRGMLGSALVPRLAAAGATVLTAGRERVDLRRQDAVETWVHDNQPDAIILAAGTVGGIEANRTRPAEFAYDNLAMNTNVIHAAAEAGVERLVFLGSSCFYPKDAEQPIREQALLTGPVEPTSEAYAVAKIAGATLCEAYRHQYGKDFIVAVPANLYGPGDKFHETDGHVIGSLMCRFHKAQRLGAKAVEIWGTGRPRRQFLYVEDAAEALLFLIQHYSSDEIVNVAGAEEVSIAELAQIIAGTVGFQGTIHFDVSRPDGPPRKALDGSRLRAAGWTPVVDLNEGIRRTYEWLRESERFGATKATELTV